MGNDGCVTVPSNDEFLALSERPPTRKAGVVAATGLVTSLLIAVLTVLPSPYAIEQPGPTYDTLASKDGVALVAIEGATTYESSGELRLTTVSFSEPGKRPFTLGRVIQAFVSPLRTVVPQEVIFGTPEEEEQQTQASAAQWISSQEAATVAALEAGGTVVPSTLTVAFVVDESLAKGLLLEGDILTALDGTELVTYSDLTALLEGRAPGDTITMTVERDGKTVEVTFDLIEDDQEPGRALMGIHIDPDFDLPVEVSVGIDRVGGPSAGMMFALAIMDKLTPEDELDGAKVAGTGEISVDGQVYPIGGIEYKLAGARAAGAEYFLAPVENCPAVIGHIPKGLSVYAVDDLSDAYAAIVAIGKHETANLPTCSVTTDK
jgi:PDZ domain-containing protein